MNEILETKIDHVGHFDKSYDDFNYACWRLEDIFSFFHHSRIIKTALVGSAPFYLLDVGCGPGVDAITLADYAEKIVGVDFSPQAIKVAQELAKEYEKDSKISFLCCDAEKLPFEEETFDAVFCMNFMHHLEKPEKALREMTRVLKKRGKLLVVEMNPRNIQMNIISRLLKHERLILRNSPQYLESLFSQAGFSKIEMSFHEYVCQPLVSFRLRKKLPFSLIEKENSFGRFISKIYSYKNSLFKRIPLIKNLATYIVIQAEK